MPILRQKYEALLEAKGWQADEEQRKAVRALGRLLRQLNVKKNFWPFGKKETPKGVYLHGGVGRGKSMLMDLFFDQLPPKIYKRRVHFHEFMIETHDWLHTNRGAGMENLLPNYARHVADNVRVLCFDEFHVTDVADAMILGRLFTALLDQDVIVIATSNWAPDNLYEGGLQRDLFLPFIGLLKKRLEVVHLDSDTDYRQLSDPDQDVYYFYPLGTHTDQKINIIFQELGEGANTSQEILNIKGRDLSVTAAGGIARFTFEQLCEQPLGAEDYITFAQTYDTVFIEGVPQLTGAKRNEAKRFILLIDCLYEAHCRVVISAQSHVRGLYTGDDHAFEFDRTISRLMEMQSCAYHEKRMRGAGAS